MRGSPRLPLIFGILSLFLVVSAWASANAQNAVANLGAPGTGLMMKLGTDDKGVPIWSPPKPAPFATLTGYFENVWWPRRIALDQVVVGNQQMWSAMESELNVRTAEATQANANLQVVKQITATNAVKSIGRVEVLCAKPSLWQSGLALREMVKQERRQNMVRYSKQASGDSSLPEFAKGYQGYVHALPEKRNSAGTCSKTSDDGAGEVWCTNPVAMREGWDLSPNTLLTSSALQTDNKDVISFTNYADMYIQSMFPKRAFQPIGADKLQPMTAAAEEILAERASYVAQINTFMKPFDDAFTERKAFDGLESRDPLVKQLQEAGYGEALIKEKLPEGQKVSQSIQDEINYVVYYQDPKTVVKNLSAANEGNTTAVVAQTVMDQVPLLYDIREELKKTNILLGALGGILMEPQYDELEAKIKGLASSGGQ